MRRVKIVCTLGPASSDPKTLTSLIKAGMDVARLNMSHGTHEDHLKALTLVRSIAADLDRNIAVLADLQGPKLRVGVMQEGGVPLVEGETITLTTEDIIGVPGRVPIRNPELPGSVQAGERILLDDGLMELTVTDHSETEIQASVLIGGILQDRKGMNLPESVLNIHALTDKDREDARWALDNEVDWIALSFVRQASDVFELKAIIRNHRGLGLRTPVISKIEKPEAIDNIDAIIGASEAVMVARGDLGIETSAEAVPMIQKQIISKCHMAAKPVITATQMLDSMIRNPRPTRAEASDVANAVLDGSDAIMLSGETAAGKYPLIAVQTMARIAEEAERISRSASPRIAYEKPDVYTSAGAICHAAVRTAEEIGAKAIVAPTMSGATSKLIAAFRPNVPVIAVTPNEVIRRRLAMYWGTYALLTTQQSDTDSVVEDALEVVQRHGFVGEGDKVVLTAGVVGGVNTATNLMMIRSIEHVLARGIGLGQKEVIGRLIQIDRPGDPKAPAPDFEIGPQDILLCRTLVESQIPLLKRAGGLITQVGGPDSLGVIVSVENGVPAVVATGESYENLEDGMRVVMDTTDGVVARWNK